MTKQKQAAPKGGKPQKEKTKPTKAEKQAADTPNDAAAPIAPELQNNDAGAPVKRERFQSFNPKLDFEVAREFRLNGRLYTAGQVLQSKRLSISNQRLRQLFEQKFLRHPDGAGAKAQLSDDGRIETRYRIERRPHKRGDYWDVLGDKDLRVNPKALSEAEAIALCDTLNNGGDLPTDEMEDPLADMEVGEQFETDDAAFEVVLDENGQKVARKIEKTPSEESAQKPAETEGQAGEDTEENTAEESDKESGE